MARTCIICGGATGSREHIFPAALGGRRTNKGIYCGDHNNGYSPLCIILLNQIMAINAFLGVRGDHAENAHSIVTIDTASNRQVKLSSIKTQFTTAEQVSEFVEGEGRKITMRFSSERQIEKWMQAEKEQGNQVQLGKREPAQPYYLSSSHIRFTLGGTEGLRAIGYVAQTFLAHYFPDVARASELDAFKAYTQGEERGDYIWWDFEPPSDLVKNTFEFGHRIIVGFDPATGSAYARVSLFSTLHFAVLFGSVPDMAEQAVIIDIDPLAEHPPEDIFERRESSAVAIVTRPSSLISSLSEDIINSRVEESFNVLLKQISTRNLVFTAEQMWEEIKGADQLDLLARKKLFETVLYRQSQRILNMMRYVNEVLKASDPLMRELAPLLDQLVASDPTAANGLSNEATALLLLAQHALLAQMLDDYTHACLDKDRLELLIEGGLGTYIVGQAITNPIFSVLKQEETLLFTQHLS
jgi:hypothetical protein